MTGKSKRLSKPEENSAFRNCRITAADSKNYCTKYYTHAVIITIIIKVYPHLSAIHIVLK